MYGPASHPEVTISQRLSATTSREALTPGLPKLRPALAGQATTTAFVPLMEVALAKSTLLGVRGGPSPIDPGSAGAASHATQRQVRALDPAVHSLPSCGCHRGAPRQGPICHPVDRPNGRHSVMAMTAMRAMTTNSSMSANARHGVLRVVIHYYSQTCSTQSLN